MMFGGKRYCGEKKKKENTYDLVYLEPAVINIVTLNIKVYVTDREV